MITLLKKINRYIVYAIFGVVITFAALSDLLMMSSSTAYTMGTGYSTLIVTVVLFSALLVGLLAKLFVVISYRISLMIFARKSGLLYPFPISFPDYEATVCAFLIPGMLLGGLAHLPALFLPSLSAVLGAVRFIFFWGSVVCAVAFFLKKYAHDYDKKSLAFSLTMLPLVLTSISFVITLVEVIR